MPAYSSRFNRDWDSKDQFTWPDVDRILLQEVRQELKKLNDQIATVRHFFRQPGMDSAVREVIRRENVKARRHHQRLRAARLRRKAARA